MMLGLAVEAALRAALLAFLVQLGLWAFRIHRPQALLTAWIVVLMASLAMPLLQWATPLRLPLLPARPIAELVVVIDPDPPLASAVVGSVSARMQELAQVGFWAEAVYLLVSGVMLLRLGVGIGLSLRLLRRASPSWGDLAGTLDIRLSRAVAAPVTVGRTILVPPEFVHWPDAVRQAVIAHEGAHVARGDYGLLVLSQLNRALFWFSPVPWALHHQLSALVELVSDDHAIRLTGDRASYAEVLLQMGRRSRHLVRGLAMARASTLQHRIERVLSDRATPCTVGWGQRLVIVAGAALISVAAASPDLHPAAPSRLAVATGSTTIMDTLDDRVSRPAPIMEPLPRPAPMPPGTEGAPRGGLLAGGRPSRDMRVMPQQSTGVPVAAQMLPRPPKPLRVPPSVRVVPTRARPTDVQGSAPAPAWTEAGNTPRPALGRLQDGEAPTFAGRGEQAYPPVVQREARAALGEPSLLKAIDQQTCKGVYLPGAASGPGAIGGPQVNSWGSLNLVRAKFFRETNGKPWLRFYLGMHDPVDLPMTVTGQELEFTAGTNTAFKVLPRGMNHLIGTTERPDGTIDLTCEEVGVHPFERRG